MLSTKGGQEMLDFLIAYGEMTRCAFNFTDTWFF